MKPLLIITYRDRPTHLNCLLNHLREHYNHIHVCVAEQDDNTVWNKGLLYNAAVTVCGRDADYFILHDVDFVAVVGKVDYGYCDVPAMVAGEASQFDYKLYYPTFFGGVVICSKEHYRTINGFPNSFRGYGGEDDSLRSSFIQKGIQPQVKMGRFECFAHPKPNIWPGSEFHNTPDYRNNLKLATAPRDFTDGISSARYEITGADWKATINNRKDTYHYIHLKIKTDGE